MAEPEDKIKPEDTPENTSENAPETPSTEAPSAAAEGAEHKPNGYVPGEPKKGYFAERRRIKRERRILRKDLKSKGITSKEDFEAIAQSLGLVLWNRNPFLLWWHYKWGAIVSSLGLKFLLGGAAAALALTFLASYITDQEGSFTINLTADMLEAGFSLYEGQEFGEPKTRLFSERLKQVNNITISDLPEDVDDIDGPHNGQNHIAITFYIRNDGEKTSSYTWRLNMDSEILAVSDAVWLMVYEDGRQIIYTREATDGKPEELYGFSQASFAEDAYDYDKQYYEKDGAYGIVTTPYAEEGIVAQGIVEDVPPGEAHKYTIVIWVEGHDPECTDEIFGGFAKYSMDFDAATPEDDMNIFSGIFRTEYEEYVGGGEQ